MSCPADVVVHSSTSVRCLAPSPPEMQSIKILLKNWTKDRLCHLTHHLRATASCQQRGLNGEGISNLPVSIVQAQGVTAWCMLLWHTQSPERLEENDTYCTHRQTSSAIFLTKVGPTTRYSTNKKTCTRFSPDKVGYTPMRTSLSKRARNWCTCSDASLPYSTQGKAHEMTSRKVAQELLHHA